MGHTPARKIQGEFSLSLPSKPPPFPLPLSTPSSHQQRPLFCCSPLSPCSCFRTAPSPPLPEDPFRGCQLNVHSPKSPIELTSQFGVCWPSSASSCRCRLLAARVGAQNESSTIVRDQMAWCSAHTDTIHLHCRAATARKGSFDLRAVHHETNLCNFFAIRLRVSALKHSADDRESAF